MRLTQPLGDGQAQPGPLMVPGEALGDLTEGLEKGAKSTVVDAPPGVRNREKNSDAAALARRQRIRLDGDESLGRELEGVADQVHEHVPPRGFR